MSPAEARYELALGLGTVGLGAVHMGITIASRHPEWARALFSGLSPSPLVLAEIDTLVRGTPIEVADGK